MNQILYNPPPTLKDKVSIIGKPFTDTCIDFINKCLIKEQNKRYSATELLLHPFITGNLDTACVLQFWPSGLNMYGTKVNTDGEFVTA